MHIVLLDAKTLGADIDIDAIKQLGTLTIYQTTKPHETLNRIKDADIVITNKVVISSEIMRQAPKLKLICIAATGMNNIDLDAAKSAHIEVKNVTGYSTASVVQHTFAIALYLLEHLSYYDDAVKSGAWSVSELFTDVSRSYSEISGKKWGIIGMGTIGQEVARIAAAFGAHVGYYATGGAPHNTHYPHQNLEELLGSCDIISIHAPLNDQTRNLINASNLKLLKEGVLLLNLGRGGIINEADLAAALNTQNIFVGLDVLEHEPINPDHPLLHIAHPSRLLITPHIAWASKEARTALVEGVVENIRGFIEGKSR